MRSFQLKHRHLTKEITQSTGVEEVWGEEPEVSSPWTMGNGMGRRKRGNPSWSRHGNNPFWPRLCCDTQVGGGEEGLTSLRDESVAYSPKRWQLGFLQGQTPGGAGQRCPWRQETCGQCGCMAQRCPGMSLLWERSNGALPWGHGAPSGTHCHGALLISMLRSPKTRMCSPLL